MNRRALLSAALVIAALAGCYTGGSVDTNRGPDTVATDGDGTEPTDERASDAGSTTKAAGLPCEVAAILNADCATCHGAPLSGGAPNRLLSYADLTKASAGNPAVTIAALALARMKSSSRPMPPEGKIESDRVAVFAKWIADGLPRGACAAKSADARPDGATEPAEPDAAPAPTSTCTSGKTGPASPRPFSILMKPGQACIACHSPRGGPAFEIAGTVYPSLHEPNDCQGAENMKVIIIDASGTAHTLPTNEVGNFTLEEPFPRPYRALVVRGTNVREMRSLQTDGDCNGCHTEWGTHSAPGRVMMP